MEVFFRRLLALAAPCYVANATPVIVARVLKRTHPIDGGRCFLDGRRILGDGKSVEGFVSGVVAGMAVGLALERLCALSTGEALTLSLGAMLGDALGSFIKRRFGLERGEPAPLLDQLSFLLIALLMYQLAYGRLDAPIVATLIAATPPVHLLANYLAYRLRLKEKPW